MTTASEVERLRLSLGALQRQNATFRQLVAIHDRLGGLVLQGADVAAITEVLADLIGRRVLLLDTQLQTLASAAPTRLDHTAAGAASDRLDRADDGPPSPAQSQPLAGTAPDRPDRTAAVGPADGRLDTSERVDHGEVWAPSEPYLSRVLESLAGERRPLRVPPMPDWGVHAACVLAPVAVGEAILAYLAILEQGEPAAGEDLDLQIVQHAATVYALSMMRERMATEVAQQLKDELFEGLLLGRAQDEQVAHERAARLGFDPAGTYRALVLVATSPTTSPDRPEHAARRRRLLDSLAAFCAARSPGSIVTVRAEELVVLAPEPGSTSLARLARQQAMRLLPGWQVTVGVGGACASAQAIARSYDQARRAVSTGLRFGKRGEVVAFDELGLYRLLFHVSDPAELRGFVDQVLGPLIEYDRQRQARLVPTLAAYLERNGSLQATARDLDLHVNSVAYRLQRIQAIAGLELDRAQDRLLAQVALNILDGLR